MSHPEHSAWRISAATIGELSFDEYRQKYIHETPKIRRFLSETRAEHFIISAPKGFGKTLLLIAKRMQLNEHSPELDRGGEILDLPGGNFPEVSQNRMAEFKSDFELWRRIWSYSIMLAAINCHARLITATQQNPQRREMLEQHMQFDRWTQAVLDNRDFYRSPTMVFTSLLDQPYSTRRMALDNINKLNLLFKSVQSQVAFFIDNVDEYFLPVLEDKSIAAVVRNGDEDERKSNEIGVNAQLALVVAAFQLHRANHHVRVYCTVRKEAFLRLHDHSAEYSQILGCTVEIIYNKNDLKIIFEKNVKLMSEDSLFPDAADSSPGARFFGFDGKVMKHRFVNGSEDVFDYVLRHTFYRPRDLMTICGEIAILAVPERTLSRIREVVDTQSSELVRQAFTEMKPFFRLPYLDELLGYVATNTLTLKDIESASDAYILEMQEKSEVPFEEWNEDYRRPFCILYQIGMLGWIEVNQGPHMEDFQRFVKPHDIEVGKTVRLPPTEKVYLIHPALDQLIFARVGRHYFDEFHRDNIIGDDLRWHEPEASLFVIKGDICGFSKVMATDFYRSISLKLHDWAKTACEDIDFVEVSGGDSITMIDRSPVKVVESMLELLKRAESHREYPITFRFGGSAGPITWEKVERRFDRKWEHTVLPLGQALRSSARLEPHAPKGRLIVDSSFVKAIGRNAEQLHIEEVGPGIVPTLLYDESKKIFVVQKCSTDPIHETRLFLVAGLS